MTPQVRLTASPVTLKMANEFVTRHHRHHGPVVGHKWSLGLYDPDGILRGVAIVGLPRARLLNDGDTLEVYRLATDGTPNACSALYGAAWRTARQNGWRKVVTYILDNEPGVSLKAAGWTMATTTRGGTWHRSSRPRQDRHPTGRKTRWERTIPGGSNSR